MLVLLALFACVGALVAIATYWPTPASAQQSHLSITGKTMQVWTPPLSAAQLTVKARETCRDSGGLTLGAILFDIHSNVVGFECSAVEPAAAADLYSTAP